MNARMENAYRSYNYSNMFELWDAYGRCSQSKRNAWEYCKALMNEKNGYGLKVISANTFQFTAGFEYEENGKNMFAYITKSSDTFAEVE